MRGAHRIAYHRGIHSPRMCELPRRWLRMMGPVALSLGVCLATGARAAALEAGVSAPPSPSTKATPALPANAKRMNHGRFRNLTVYSPQGTPTSFVMLLSDSAGWNARSAHLAQMLAQHGALVAGIAWPSFKANLEADAAKCVFPDGDLENLSHFVQAYQHLPTYLPPLLMGDGAGGTIAYAALAQSPKDTFAGALTLDFCPTVTLRKPFCKGAGLAQVAHGRRMEFLPAKSLSDPWITLQSDANACPAAAVQAFVAQVPGASQIRASMPAAEADAGAGALPSWPPMLAAFKQMTHESPARPVALPPAALGDLPVVEIPAVAGSAAADQFALIMSGDGGWAGLDEEVAAALAARGIPVVGLDSLRYYWTARTPEGVASDTDRIIRYYLNKLGKARVMLIGYSQGADVLPFAVNRLPAATRARVSLAAVMGMSEHALFEFHLTSWVSDDDSGPATLPEVNRISGVPLLCIYGADEDDSLCPRLDPKRFKVVQVKGGHHFNGDYAGLAQQILIAAH